MTKPAQKPTDRPVKKATPDPVQPDAKLITHCGAYVQNRAGWLAGFKADSTGNFDFADWSEVSGPF